MRDLTIRKEDDKKISNYVCYHLHTEDSLLDSCTNHKLYTDKAVELGQNAIAFTEHGNTYNWIEKKMYANEKGLKFIFGIEIYLTKMIDGDNKIRDNYHTILLAKNKAGMQEIHRLCKLASHNSHRYFKPRITFEEFFNISDNVIKISACLASPLNYFRKNHDDKELFKRLVMTYDYLEIQPHQIQEQKEYNQFLYKLSQNTGIPLIAGTDTHSLDTYKAECRQALLDSKEIMFNEDGSDEGNMDLTYKSYYELVKMFEAQGILPEEVYLEAINNTNIMADNIIDEPLDTSVKYPKVSDDEEAALKKRIVSMFKDKLQRGIISKEEEQQFRENIKEEFRVFKKINMIGFMLFMSDLIIWCWNNGIPIGFCRGSVGGSSIAYITDIIDVNPVRWKTVFSRFANEDRQEVGDIDVDISPDQRDKVYQHIIDGFGEDNTAYILAIGTVSDKGTIDEIGRALSYRWIDKHYCKDLSDFKRRRQLHAEYRNNPDNPYNLDKVASIKEAYEIDKEGTINKYPELFYYFDGLVNTAVSQSMHPAGIVVSPVTLNDNYGVFWSSDDKLILSINMEEVHECGLVKYDCLGLKNVEIIRKTCEYAGIPYPRSHEINWNDEKVWTDLITCPAGIFQFEGSYAFDLIKKYIPTCINDLSIVNAALRPSGETYRDRLLAREANHNPSELIDELLKDNQGYLIFQEDTLKFLTNICGLSGSEADNVRRAIGRKQIDRLQKALPSILEGYCRMSPQPREVAEKEAQEFLDIIESSSRYQFGFNHSTGYSMIGYTCAYLRYYYPEEFIAAYLNCANNDDDIRYGTDLARIKKVKINNIKFGKSMAEYAVDKKNHAVYKGISSIKYMNSQIADELYTISSRRYSSFTELLNVIKSETSVDDRQLRILIKLNFFSDFGLNKYLLDVYDMYDSIHNRKQFKKIELEKLGIPEYLMKQFSLKETEKMYKDVDMDSLFEKLIESIPQKSITYQEQIKAEVEYLGYPDYINPKIGKNLYIVTDYKTYKDECKPYFSVRRCTDGETFKTKIKNRKLYIQQPFDLFSILKIDGFDYEFKKKKVDDKWIETDEREPIVNSYEVIVK